MSVSVITRTKDRPLLLPRALKSVASQTYKDFEWIVVNDGGAPATVDQTVERAKAQGITARAIHHASSRGMEAASNAGLDTANGEFILIHDDDDTLEPEFLQRTASFLNVEPHFLGVVTHTNKIVEKIEENSVEVVSSLPLNPLLEAIDLAQMAMRNQFPPISHLFRKSACEEIGGFDPELPVLGDWDFNLRLLLKGDIGFLPEYLANHHHRYELAGAAEEYGNTVTLGISKHLDWESRYRNHKIRTDICQGTMGLGHLLASGKQNHENFKELEKLRVSGDGWRKLMQLSYKFGLARILKRAG